MPATFVVNPSLAVSTSSTITNVGVSIVSVQILALNESRIGATIYNDSTSNLYLLLGTGIASDNNYSVLMMGGAYYETPFYYKGPLQGIWSASSSGSARCTELI